MGWHGSVSSGPLRVAAKRPTDDGPQFLASWEDPPVQEMGLAAQFYCTTREETQITDRLLLQNVGMTYNLDQRVPFIDERVASVLQIPFMRYG